MSDYAKAPVTVTVTVDELQRQLIIQALATMATERPGYEDSLREIARLLDDDHLALFHAFKLLARAMP